MFVSHACTYTFCYVYVIKINQSINQSSVKRISLPAAFFSTLRGTFEVRSIPTSERQLQCNATPTACTCAAAPSLCIRRSSRLNYHDGPVVVSRSRLVTPDAAAASAAAAVETAATSRNKVGKLNCLIYCLLTSLSFVIRRSSVIFLTCNDIVKVHMCRMNRTPTRSFVILSLF